MNGVLTRPFKAVFDFLSSYTLSCVLFLFLLLLTYLGTVEQVQHGLYLTQKKYFESLFLVHELWGTIPILLPGVYLLLILLFINITLGGIVRIRKGWSQFGILVTHAGILLLLIGGFVTYRFSTSGHMTLYENQQSDVFQSYYDWELAVDHQNDDGTATEYTVPQDKFVSTHSGKAVTVTAPDWPFDLVLSDYMPNAEPRPKGPMVATDAEVVDGVYLQSQPLAREQERNAAGLYAMARVKDSGKEYNMLLWGLQQSPAKLTLPSGTWTVDLRHVRWPVPFTIRLDKFTRELHPGTNMPSKFMSDVTKIENGMDQKVKITMNEPLRSQGYTFYQASWGPQNAGPNTPLFSTFAVVRNPADHFPLYACIVITSGMFIHFVMRLRRHLNNEAKRQA